MNNGGKPFIKYSQNRLIYQINFKFKYNQKTIIIP